jgi:hypothetical protein
MAKPTAMDSAVTPVRFTGRAREFDALVSFRTGRVAFSREPAAAMVQGPSGVGKTALIDACLEQTLGLHQRFYWFKSDPANPPTDPGSFAYDLAESVLSSQVSPGARIPDLLADLLPFSRNDVSLTIQPTPRPVYTPIPGGIPKADHGPLPSPDQLAHAFVDGLLRILLPGSDSMPRQVPADPPRVAFVIDHCDRLSMEVIALLLHKAYAKVQNLLMDVWSQERETVILEIARLEKELARNEQERQALCDRIQEANQSVARQTDMLPSPPANAPVPLTHTPRPRPLKTALGIQALGVICIYTGLLFFHSTREMAITYIALGVYLFGWGIYMSCSGRTGYVVANANESSVNVQDYLTEEYRRQEGDLNLLRLQAMNLENRQNTLFAQYARSTRTLSDCYRRLNEPFI